MSGERCAEYAWLAVRVGEVLERLTTLTQAQLSAFRANDHGTEVLPFAVPIPISVLG
jgi:hypothetical protein